jgi:hypothetical protein
MKRTILFVAILLSGLVLTSDVEGQRRKTPRQTQPKPPATKATPAPTPTPVGSVASVVTAARLIQYKDLCSFTDPPNLAAAWHQYEGPFSIRFRPDADCENMIKYELSNLKTKHPPAVLVHISNNSSDALNVPIRSLTSITARNKGGIVVAAILWRTRISREHYPQAVSEATSVFVTEVGRNGLYEAIPANQSADFVFFFPSVAVGDAIAIGELPPANATPSQETTSNQTTEQKTIIERKTNKQKTASSAVTATPKSPSQPAAENTQPSKLVPSVRVGADYVQESDGNYKIKVLPTSTRRLPAGTKVLAFEFTLDPENASLEGFGFEGGDIATTQMQFTQKNNFVIIMGQAHVNRVTGFAQRADGSPFRPGKYSFGVYINGNRGKPDAEIKFIIQ